MSKRLDRDPEPTPDPPIGKRTTNRVPPPRGPAPPATPAPIPRPVETPDRGVREAPGRGPATRAPTPRPRRITVEGNIHALDHESIGPNERETALFFADAIVNPDGLTWPLLKKSVGVGGEVRAELELYVRMDLEERCWIDGIARLFEGSSESTNDLEDEKLFLLYVPAWEPLHHTFELVNIGRGNIEDKASFTLTLNNLPVKGEADSRSPAPIFRPGPEGVS